MCGLFGFVSKEGRRFSEEHIQEIAINTMSRGPHAWGMAWIDSRGRMKHFKQTGRVEDSLGLLAMAKDAVMLIGHCRYATHGDPENNLNNHPHPADGGWVVHNGMIGHYRELIRQHELPTTTECDSEVIGLLIERLDGTLLERCTEAVELCKGKNPFAMLGLWREGLFVGRSNGQPLHIGETKHSYYIASLPAALPGKIYKVKNDSVFCFREPVEAL